MYIRGTSAKVVYFCALFFPPVFILFSVFLPVGALLSRGGRDVRPAGAAPFYQELILFLIVFRYQLQSYATHARTARFARCNPLPLRLPQRRNAAYALPALYRKPNPVPSNPSITLRPAALHSTVRVTILTCAGAARECASHDGRSRWWSERTGF